VKVLFFLVFTGVILTEMVNDKFVYPTGVMLLFQVIYTLRFYRKNKKNK
jgi:hypothetical protein